MNYFFGPGVFLEQEILWVFTLNHLIFALFSLAVMFAFYFGVHTKSKKGILITKITLIGLLFVLEVGRMIWLVINNNYHGYENNPFAVWRFTICAVNVWVTIVVLTFSIFVNSQNRGLMFFKNVLAGSALLGGVIASFILPVHIDGYRSFAHFRNMQTILVHYLLILAPLFLIKTGELQIRFKNLWQPTAGFVGVAAIGVVASHISNYDFNFSFEVPFAFGPSLPFGVHLLVTFIVVYSLSVVMYALCEYHYRRKNKDWKENESNEIQTKYLLINLASILFVVLTSAFGPWILGADVTAYDPIDRSMDSYLALVLLLPMFLMIAIIMYTDRLNTKEIQSSSK